MTKSRPIRKKRSPLWRRSRNSRDIELTQREIENTGEQIHQYSCLIAEEAGRAGRAGAGAGRPASALQAPDARSQERGGSIPLGSHPARGGFSPICSTGAPWSRDHGVRSAHDGRSSVAEKVVTAKEELAAQKTVLEQKRTELDRKQQGAERQGARMSDALITASFLNDKAELAAEAEEIRADGGRADGGDRRARGQSHGALGRVNAAHPPAPKPTPRRPGRRSPLCRARRKARLSRRSRPRTPAATRPRRRPGRPLTMRPSVPADGE